ncbi:hypothetical protein QFC22_004762 [Naganishia vaughanmartiniae]|uniref:Uncharacterized protein n=1 Tax=Naganishia vaughanmartiniae TaxID=1424756 RepID=A0ACC2WZ56_9TREE|nr:hypothetical protein QFC22_004762 [Naganishia vaughanmartiniae]
MTSITEERPARAPRSQSKPDANAARTGFRIIFQKAGLPPIPPRPAPSSSSSPHHNLAAAASADPKAQADLLEALSNPFLYQRHAHLVAYLQTLIQSLETACAAVHAYARGEYMTDDPIKLALKRVAEEWSRVIIPLQLLNGSKVVKVMGEVPGWENEEAKKKAVGRKLTQMAMAKQKCISAVKRLQLAYEEGSQFDLAKAEKTFDAALTQLIDFATLVATIDHELTVAIQCVVIKVLAEGDKLQALANRDKQK